MVEFHTVLQNAPILPQELGFLARVPGRAIQGNYNFHKEDSTWDVLMNRPATKRGEELSGLRSVAAPVQTSYGLERGQNRFILDI